MKAPGSFINLCLKALLVAGLFFLNHDTLNAQDILTGFTSNGGPEGRGTVFSINTSTNSYNLIRSFADWGITPNGSLLQGDDGNFYGMTSDGGTYNHAGTIFMMTPAGSIKILKQFNSSTEGAYAYGELIKGTDGSFYGLCGSGGSTTYGTLFKITTAGVFTLLKTFTYATDGSNPKGHLVQAKDGNFYGVTYGGGANGTGTIFRYTPAGVFTVLRSFSKTTDGAYCYNSLTEGKDGFLYGMTYSGGTYGYGTIFRISTTGAFSVLKHLNSATDGGSTQSDLIQASDGNFYGMTYSGGTGGNGTIFKMTPAGIYTVLKHLSSSKDGGSPYGNLVQHTDGNLYGMTRGGTSGNAGGIFKITLAGVFTQLHSFVTATEGTTANGSLIQGKDGNLYGLTSTGGVMRGGTAFKVTTAGALTVLANFNGSAAGNAPYESPVKGSDSAYYGLNYSGGANGNGSIFKVCGGATSVLFSFNRNSTGGYPKGSLIRAGDGNFYGMTSDGGSYSGGTIFRITPSGTFTVLRHLSSATDGIAPQGSLVQGKDGNLYGMTSSGGSKSGGTIFRISLTGTYTVLKHLSYATDGSDPEGNLTQVNDSTFYGLISNGSKAFKITTNGNFTIVHNFLSTNEGSYPLGSLLLGKDGNLYGMNSSSGLYSGGTIFKMTLSGTVTTLKHFNSVPDGRTPKGNLVQGSDGSFYGMTSTGGSGNAGTLFRLSSSNVYTVLKHFNLTTDGGNPFGSLIPAPKNNLVANGQSVSLAEDTQKPITLTGTGGSPLTYNITGNPKNGTLTGSGNARTYIPGKNYNGSDQFSFTVSVGCQVSPAAIVNLTVTPVADSPVLAPIGPKTIVAGKQLAFTATATDPDAGQKLTFSLTGAPAGATINATTGAFTWTPTIAGAYTITFKVTDNGSPALYDQEQVKITVTSTFTAFAADKTTSVNIAHKGLYPNPVAGSFFLDVDVSGKANIRLLNEKGIVVSSGVYTFNGQPLQLNAAGLNTGVYWLELYSGNKKASFKFIKQ